MVRYHLVETLFNALYSLNPTVPHRHPHPEFTHFLWSQHPLAERFFPQVQTGDKKVLHRKKKKRVRGGWRRSMNQKARKWNSLYKRQGNFNVRQGTVELCSMRSLAEGWKEQQPLRGTSILMDSYSPWKAWVRSVCLRGTQLKLFTKYHHRFRVSLLRWLVVRITGKQTSGLLCFV